jgi:hypothetical protein
MRWMAHPPDMGEVIIEIGDLRSKIAVLAGD